MNEYANEQKKLTFLIREMSAAPALYVNNSEKDVARRSTESCSNMAN